MTDRCCWRPSRSPAPRRRYPPKTAEPRPSLVLREPGSSRSATCRSPTALRGRSTRVSFEIRRGEIFGLLGPERRGQDEHAERDRRADQAAVRDDPARRHRHQAPSAEARARMGVQLQATSFQSELTIRQIVRLYAGLYGVELSGQRDQRRPACDRARGRGTQAVQAALRRTAATPLPLHRGRPRPGVTAARRAHRRPRSAVAPPAVGPDRAHPPGGRKHPLDHALDGGGPGGLRPGRDHRQRHAPDDRDAARPDREAQERPGVREVAHGEVTLEDVFIGLTGSEIRD